MFVWCGVVWCGVEWATPCRGPGPSTSPERRRADAVLGGGIDRGAAVCWVGPDAGVKTRLWPYLRLGAWIGRCHVLLPVDITLDAVRIVFNAGVNNIEVYM